MPSTNRALPRLAAALLVLSLAACAGSVAPPTVVTALPAAQRATLHLSAVSTQAAPGVALSQADTTRISELVQADLAKTAPGLLDPAAPGPKALQITITRYDAGNATARFLLAGLGQIRLDGTVKVIDPATTQTVAEYKVEKQFAFGGLYGGLTSMTDVEKGFSTSVAALFKP